MRAFCALPKHPSLHLLKPPARKNDIFPIVIDSLQNQQGNRTCSFQQMEEIQMVQGRKAETQEKPLVFPPACVHREALGRLQLEAAPGLRPGV